MGNGIQRLNEAFDKTKRMHHPEREANRFWASGVSFFRIKLEECRRFFRQRFLPNKFYPIVTISLAAETLPDYGDLPAVHRNSGE